MDAGGWLERFVARPPEWHDSIPPEKRLNNSDRIPLEINRDIKISLGVITLAYLNTPHSSHHRNSAMIWMISHYVKCVLGV